MEIKNLPNYMKLADCVFFAVVFYLFWPFAKTNCRARNMHECAHVISPLPFQLLFFSFSFSATRLSKCTINGNSAFIRIEIHFQVAYTWCQFHWDDFGCQVLLKCLVSIQLARPLSIFRIAIGISLNVGNKRNIYTATNTHTATHRHMYSNNMSK